MRMNTSAQRQMPKEEGDHRSFPMLTAQKLDRQLDDLRQKLADARTLQVHANQNGIYAASASQDDDAHSGYQNAWLRDNAMVAYSRWVCGDTDSAAKTARGMTAFLETQAKKMERIIAKPSRKEIAQERPHIRFDAKRLQEIDEVWPHAQNDALGYTLWLRLKLANEAGFALEGSEREVFGVLVAYFRAIQYWKDRDSGAWEEARKINSSSVGAVTAGLAQLAIYLKNGGKLGRWKKDGKKENAKDDVRSLIAQGEKTLQAQLPFEAPPERMADSALLFLIYPLQIVQDEKMQRLITSMIRARLPGSHGIRRYIGDSYFCQDYDQWFPPEERSSEFSSKLAVRDAFLQPGCEAQWCLFDPLLSVIFGKAYAARPERTDFLELQLEHANRSIAQLDEQGRCPELYFLKDGKYVANEHTPLAWTQANLSMAVKTLEESVRKRKA
jgi:phosphorylase kinase alpha/beta subunit